LRSERNPSQASATTGEAPRLGWLAIGPLTAGPRHVVGDERVTHEADAVRIGQRDRRGEHPRLHEPGPAGHLAVAVEDMRSGEDGITSDLRRVWQDHRHARAHRHATDNEWPLSRNHRAVPNSYTPDIRDRVPRTGLEPSPRPLLDGVHDPRGDTHE